MAKTKKIYRPKYDSLKLIVTGIGFFLFFWFAIKGINWAALYFFNDDSNMGFWYLIFIIWAADHFLTGAKIRKDIHKIKDQLHRGNKK